MLPYSVRSTNVYEEQSLGLFQEDEDSDEEEEGFQPIGPRVTVWSRYLAMHARRQLAFGETRIWAPLCKILTQRLQICGG